mmetsp:Transcript_8798/g.25108  ORF Transcript_8798/g.25108 Transcript_8798/m.25108 type:complete len:221 (-) Transcript_8798:512-1174(-)
MAVVEDLELRASSPQDKIPGDLEAIQGVHRGRARRHDHCIIVFLTKRLERVLPQSAAEGFAIVPGAVHLRDRSLVLPKVRARGHSAHGEVNYLPAFCLVLGDNVVREGFIQEWMLRVRRLLTRNPSSTRGQKHGADVDAGLLQFHKAGDSFLDNGRHFLLEAPQARAQGQPAWVVARHRNCEDGIVRVEPVPVLELSPDPLQGLRIEMILKASRPLVVAL